MLEDWVKSRGYRTIIRPLCRDMRHGPLEIRVISERDVAKGDIHRRVAPRFDLFFILSDLFKLLEHEVQSRLEFSQIIQIGF